MSICGIALAGVLLAVSVHVVAAGKETDLNEASSQNP